MIENPGKYKEKEKIDKKTILRKLALEIARKYNIEEKNAEKLIKKETLNSIESLKSELKNNENLANLTEQKLEKLFFTLKGALEVVENTSKLKIEVLKSELIKQIEAGNFGNEAEKYFNKKLLQKAKNPKLPHEHILGITLGTANTILSTTESLYQIGKGIFKSPYDLYLIFSGKGKLKNLNKI